jgi:hypothetical protein
MKKDGTSFGSRKKNRSLMKHAFTFLFLIFCHVSFAQTYSWAVNAGGSSEDRGFGIATDKAGNIYTTGQFRNTATFGSLTVTSAGVEDVFVSKQDGLGNFLWVFRGGGANPDIGYDIVTDTAGNCYVTGSYYDQATFGNITLHSAGTADYDIFVLKLNSSGVLQWAKSAGGSNYDIGRGIAISGSNLYVSGNIQGNVSFGNVTATGPGLYDAFVAKYTLSGTVNWVSIGGGTGYDISNGVCADAAGNAYLTGYFQGTATFGSNTVTNASTLFTDAFVAKVNSSGVFQWVKSGGNPSDDDIGRAIDCDSSGNVYMGGEFRGTATFGNITITNAGIADIFVAKYNTSGTLLYVSTEGADGGDYCYGVAASSSKVYITGLFNGTVQFGTTTLTSNASNDIYIAELDAATGSFVWTEQAGGLGDDAGRAVAFNRTGFIAYTGDFEHSPSTFNQFTLNSNGGHDIFIAKIKVGSCTVATASINASGPTTFCTGGSVLLTSTTANAITVQWNKNGINIVGATSPSYTATQAGSYTLVVTDNCGNQTTSNAIIINTNKPPTATVTPSGDINICSGDTLILTANTGVNFSYQWIRNNTILPGQTNSTLVVTSGGNYKVTVTKTTTGCSATSKKVAKVHVTCKAAISGLPSVALSPNPSATNFTVNGIPENSHLAVYNSVGQLLEQQNVGDGTSFGEDLPPGIYFVHIVSDGHDEVHKVIKE